MNRLASTWCAWSGSALPLAVARRRSGLVAARRALHVAFTTGLVAGVAGLLVAAGVALLILALVAGVAGLVISARVAGLVISARVARLVIAASRSAGAFAPVLDPERLVARVRRIARLILQPIVACIEREDIGLVAAADGLPGAAGDLAAISGRGPAQDPPRPLGGRAVVEHDREGAHVRIVRRIRHQLRGGGVAQLHRPAVAALRPSRSDGECQRDGKGRHACAKQCSARRTQRVWAAELVHRFGSSSCGSTAVGSPSWPDLPMTN